MYDAGAIRATAELDTKPFFDNVRLMRAEGKKLGEETYTPKIGADAKDADATILDIRKNLDEVAKSKTTAKISADTTEASAKLLPLTAKLEDIGRQITTAKVDANTDAARRRLAELELTLRRISLSTTSPRVSDLGLERANISADSLLLKLEAISHASAHPSVSAGSGGGRGGVSGVLHSLGSHAPGFGALAIGAAIPAIGPLVGLAAGAGAALLTPFTAAGIGIASFAAAAHSSIGKVEADLAKVNTLEQAYNRASTDKTRAAANAAEQKFWHSLPPAQQQAVKNVNKLKTEWSGFQKSLQPETFPLISGGIKLASVALGDLQPVAAATGKALDGIETSVEHAFGNPFWHSFFTQFLPNQASKATNSFATALGDLATGGAHLVEAFAPLGGSFETDLDRLTKRFEDWTEGSGPSKFVSWVHAHAPELKHDLGELVGGVAKASKDLVPVGEDVIHIVGDVASGIDKISPGHIRDIGAALLFLGGGLKAIKFGGSISGSLASIAALRGGSRIASGAAGAAGAGALEGEAAAAGGAGIGITAAGLGAFLAPVVAGGIAIAITDAMQSKAPGASAVRTAQAVQPKPFTVGRGAQVTGVAGMPKQSEAEFIALANAENDDVNYTMALNKAFAATRRAFLNATPALHDFRVGLADMGNVAQQVGSHKLTGLTVAAQANRDTLREEVGRLNDYRQGLVSAGIPLDIIRAKVDQHALSLIHDADQTYKNKGAVDALLRSLGLFPKKIETQVTADTAAAKKALAELQKQKDELAARTIIAVSVDTTGQFQTHIPRPAPGGPIAPVHHSSGAHGTFKSDTHLRVLGHGSSISPRHLPGFITSMDSPTPNAPTSSSSHSSASSSAAAARAAASHALASSNALASITSYAGLTFTSELEGTAKQIRAGVINMIDRLNSAVRNHYLDSDKTLVQALHSAYQPLRHLAAQEVVTGNALNAAQSRLSTLRGDASSLRSGTLSAYQGLGDVSQLTNVSSVAGLLSVIGKQDKVGAAFTRNLATLRKKGLSKEEYDELQQAGPAAAGQVVALLATASTAQIRALNKDTDLLTSLGITTGKAGASYVYGSRIANSQHDVNVLRRQDHELIAAQRATVKALVALTKDGLHDKGTHAGLATLHADLADVKRLLASVTNAPKDARSNQRTSVAGHGVNRR